MASASSTQALIDAYNKGGGKPLTTAQIGSAIGTPTVPNNTMPAPAQAPMPASIPKSGTDDEILKAILDFKTSLNSSNEAVTKAQAESDAFDASRRTSFRNIEGQPIAMPFVTGQQSAWEKTYGDQGIALQNKLANLQAKRTADISGASTNLDLLMKEREYENSQKQYADSQNKPIEVDGQLVQRQSDGTYKSVFGVPKSTTTNQPASVQEYEYAKANGYTGSFNDYQNADANRKKSIAAAGVGPAGLTPQQVTAFNGIVAKYNSSPLIAASDRTPVLENAINAVKADPGNAALQLNLAYAYIQALDTYQSAVREGELGLVNSIDSKVGQFAGSIQQITNGQIVRPEVAKQIADAADGILKTIKSAAASKAQSYASQANTVGLGDAWNTYISGSSPSYGGGGGGGNNPLGI
jgi:hypothetical protein